MKVSRTWSTPLAAAAFVTMAVTGALLFFHLQRGLVGTLHEWGGWLFMLAVTLHLVGNAPAFKAHAARLPPRLVVGAALVVIALAAALGGSGGRDRVNPTRAAVDRLTAAPLTALAPIVGRDVDALVADLRHAGFESASPDSTLDALAGDERDARLRALAIALPPAAQD
ncbi:MAG: DUF4405 domain-containing protein [Sandaracinus sp.]